MAKVVASIEARMGSSRLPGKVLMDIEGKPSLERQLIRLKECKKLDDIVLATSISSKDDVLEIWARDQEIPCYRGSEFDVLDRVVEAHKFMGSDLIVETTGDCPLIDPSIIDLAVETFLVNDCDVVTNSRIPSYPEGADVQVFSLNLLKNVAMTIFDPAVREHVSLYFYENPDVYKILDLFAPLEKKAPNRRLQLDYKEDLEFIRQTYKYLEPIYGPSFGVESILNLIQKYPEIGKINSACKEKPVR